MSAALLHDTVEDTALGIEQIEGHFGVEIAGLVAELTEDLRIRRYPARKAEARGRAIRDRRVADLAGQYLRRQSQRRRSATKRSSPPHASSKAPPTSGLSITRRAATKCAA